MPKGYELRQKWLKSIYSHETRFSESMKICELHFVRSLMWKTRLAPEAVPTIFNWTNGRMIQPHGIDATSKTDFFGTSAEQVDDKSIIIKIP